MTVAVPWSTFLGLFPDASEFIQSVPGYELDITRMHQAWNVGNGLCIERIANLPGVSWGLPRVALSDTMLRNVGNGVSIEQIRKIPGGFH